MSTGQLLLTVGVALWVFDAKKLPTLVSHLAVIIAAGQRYYAYVIAACDTLLQQELHKVTLERNERKAKQFEENRG